MLFCLLWQYCFVKKTKDKKVIKFRNKISSIITRNIKYPSNSINYSKSSLSLTHTHLSACFCMDDSSSHSQIQHSVLINYNIQQNLVSGTTQTLNCHTSFKSVDGENLNGV